MSIARVNLVGALVVPFLLTLGCSEPDRLGYVKIAAKEVCEAARACDNLGPDGFHASYEECIIEEQSRFNTWWPADKCDDGRIDADKFDRCMDRAERAVCDGGIGDWVSVLEHCTASSVCGG